MIELFSSVRELTRLDRVCIDNNIFKLHYWLTVLILVTFSIFVTSNQFIGDPINCIIDEIPSRTIDQYCWVYGTYTIPNREHGISGRDMIQPGVTNYVQGSEKEKYHMYYKWVCFALFFQAVLFYVPRYIWKIWEGGRIKMLTVNLNMPILDFNLKEDRKIALVNYFKLHLHRHDWYAFKFFICELLNLTNVLCQIFFMDYFLDGQFTTYGIEILKFAQVNPDTRSDPMSRIFPKTSKCLFRKYGPSGSIQSFDALCVLPLNVINEKIYIFLWFWFLF